MVEKLDPREATESFAAVSSEASSASGHPILSMQPLHFCPSLGYQHFVAQLSPLTSFSPSDPPHLQLWHFFFFWVGPSDPHKKAYGLYCTEKPVSSPARKKSVPLVEFQHLYSQPDPICLIDFRFHLFCWDVFQQWLLWVFCKLLPLSNIFPSCFYKYKYWFMTHSLAVNPML